MKPILEMKGITKTFPGVKALTDVSFSLMKGDFLGICGENGAGKSTLMKILSGSYSHNEYQGNIFMNGDEVKFTSIKDSQNYGIEMTYQELNVMLDATVAENLMVGNLPIKNGFVDYRTMYASTKEFLNKLEINLDPKQILRTVTNSGQIQMISILRAVMKKPKILVLDEPTTALTEKETDLVFKIMEQLRQEGVTCIYISHKIEEVYKLCNKVLVLRDGEKIAEHAIGDVAPDTLIQEMIGRELSNAYRHVDVHTDEVVLQVKNLKIPNPNISTKNIIDDLSFELHKGEVLGLGGLVGSGRSEILGAIFGQITEGVTKTLTICGKEVSIQSPGDAVKEGIGFLTEERRVSGLILPMGIRENISIASLSRLKGKLAIDKKDETVRTREYFDRLRIKAPSQETIVGTLSGGNQQKVVLAKWLMTECQILLLDEPTKGIDVGAKNEFYNIIDELTANGISIILVSSDMPEFISLCDRCIVISEGHASAELVGEGISQENIMRAVI